LDDRFAGRGNEGLERNGGLPPARSNSSSTSHLAGSLNLNEPTTRLLLHLLFAETK